MYTYRVYEMRNSTNSASPSIMKSRQPKSIIIQKKKVAEKDRSERKKSRRAYIFLPPLFGSKQSCLLQ